MSTWAISVADTFFNELLNLPQSISKKVSKVVKILENDPISAQGDAKKLKGYANNIYRVRLGDYRLFYSFGQGWVKLLSIRKRDERTYELELPEFEAPAPPPATSLLNPQQVAPDESRGVKVESRKTSPPTPKQEITTALPVKFTPSLLKQWQIPEEYWSDLLQVQNSEALLDLPLPDKYLSRILDNCYPRSLEEIERSRDYLLKTPKDLDRFVEGNLSAFLLKLDPEQEKLRDFGSSGPTLVKGGPGTGKSTLALYRVQKLLDLGLKPILFTTYTNALVTYSEQLLEQLLGQPPEAAGVKVTTVDSLTYQYYVRTYGKPNFAKDEQCLAYLEIALQTADIPASNVFERRVRQQTLERLGTPYLLQEIRDVIEAWGVSTLDEYQALERRGRRVPLKANIREALWAVYQTWRELMTQNKHLIWEQLRLKALEVVTQLSTPPYQAVVIDEAQDLSPVALRFLLALVPSLQGVYLTADASQSLYQRGFNWKQVHTDLKVTGRTLTLRRNYRNTQQITAACAQILEGTTAGDTESRTLHSQFSISNPQSLNIFNLRDEVIDDYRRYNEFTKLSRLSSEGRSTATTLLCLSTVNRLKSSPAIKPEAAKILSFTDNRQDASLQAGHFNDFVQTSFLRAALNKALQTNQRLTHSQLASVAVQHMGLSQSSYAIQPAEYGPGKRRNERIFRELVEYRLYEDLRRGWRIVQPNLEQCGLLSIEYEELQEICSDRTYATVTSDGVTVPR